MARLVRAVPLSARGPRVASRVPGIFGVGLAPDGDGGWPGCRSNENGVEYALVMSRTMRAALQDRYGSVDVVRVAEVPTPEPTGDQVRVRVVVAGVNRADLDALGPKPGFVRLFMGLRAPRNPGMGIDIAGVVDAVGPDAIRFKPGDRVFADIFSFAQQYGAFAEYVVVSEKSFLPIPEGMSFETAATLPHSAVLAVQGLRRKDGSTFGPGAKVLVDGASGNVGPFAVQIAKARGAEVTGVASGAKLDFVRALGADHVIDYRMVDYTKGRERYDWIVAADSHHSIRAARRVLAPGGTYITLGGTSATILDALVLGPLASVRSDRWSGLLLWWKPFNESDVRTVVELIEEGKVAPAIDRTYPLDQVVEALRYVDEGHPRGKVLITP
jgi:NADPH:quinone reductase-like Zn-dependent oxidoreductase